MSKKFIIILISSVLGLLLVSLVGYYFIIQTNESAVDGSPTGFRGFFPFGGDSPAETETPTTEEPRVEPEKPQITNFTQKLRKLSVEQVAGAGILDVKAGSVVRYIEKATGHIYEVELFSPKQIRISNTTMPLVYEAMWGDNNNSLIARYLKDDNQTIDTYSLSLKNLSSTTENTISGVVFPGKLSDVASFGNSVFYLEQNDTYSNGYISAFDGTKKKLIWSSSLKEVLPQYVNAKTVSITTKPYPNVPGFLYFVDTTNGQSKKIIGGVVGLTTLSNDLGTQVLYFEQGEAASLYLYDIKNKTTAKLYPTTFPEKCVWSKKNPSIVYCAVPQEFINKDSLTNWYMGFVSFTDDIWKFDLKENTSVILENLAASSGNQIDVIKPILSQNEQYLVFMNKIDNTLWSLDLLK